jgi:hypothetical protein
VRSNRWWKSRTIDRAHRTSTSSIRASFLIFWPALGQNPTDAAPGQGEVARYLPSGRILLVFISTVPAPRVVLSTPDASACPTIATKAPLKGGPARLSANTNTPNEFRLVSFFITKANFHCHRCARTSVRTSFLEQKSSARSCRSRYERPILFGRQSAAARAALADEIPSLPLS